MINIEIIFILIIFNFLLFINYSKISKLINIYDAPDFKRKIHKSITPLYGGVIIFLNLTLYSLFLFADLISYEVIFFDSINEFVNFIIIGFILFFTGLYDDKKQLSPNIKLLIVFFSIIVLTFFNEEILISELNFSFLDQTINLGNFSYFLTILCFLLFINACNMFDGINLQSSTFFLICILFQYSITGFNHLLLFLIIPLVFIILLNASGKIFIGDGGVYLFSFIIGYIFIKLYNQNIIINADTIFIIMMIPGFDLLRLFIERILKKKHPFSPDKFHIHHLIYNKVGYRKSQILLFFIVLIPIVSSKFIFEQIYIIFISLILYSLLIYLLRKKTTS